VGASPAHPGHEPQIQGQRAHDTFFARNFVALGKRLDHFLFHPTSPWDLGFCRFLFFLGVLIFHLPRNFGAWGNVSLVHWRPVWLFQKLHLRPMTPGHLQWIAIAWDISLALACLGLLTRFATVAALVLGAYVLGLPQNFGKVGHGDPVLILTMLILALSRCGDAFSIDAWMRKTKPQPSGEYTWPIQLACILLAIVFCAAGATKLVRSGFEWITSDNLQILLLQHHFALKDPFTTLGLHIARHPLLCKVLAGMTVALELSMPLALLSRKLRRVLVPSAFLMQIGIGITMGVYFTQFMICYLFWVPWGRLLEWVRRKRAPVTNELLRQ
jgi:hypothetical protein